MAAKQVVKCPQEQLPVKHITSADSCGNNRVVLYVLAPSGRDRGTETAEKNNATTSIPKTAGKRHGGLRADVGNTHPRGKGSDLKPQKVVGGDCPAPTAAVVWRRTKQEGIW